MFLQGLVFVLLKSSIRRPHGADVDGTEAPGCRRRSPLTVHLKPYWGKPTVRNFRGGRGNPKLDRARRAPLPYSAVHHSSGNSGVSSSFLPVGTPVSVHHSCPWELRCQFIILARGNSGVSSSFLPVLTYIVLSLSCL